jgi:outer membrane protein
MRKVITIVFVLASGVVLGQANAELNGLIHQSFTYFPQIQQLAKSEEVGELRINVAESNYLPSINGTGSYAYINPVSKITLPIPGLDHPLQFAPNNNYNLNVGLNQTIWDFGKTRSQVEKAKADLLVSHQNTEAAKLMVASQVVGIYYSMIYLRQSIEVQDSIISFYEEDKKIIQGKIDNGDALRIDITNIENNIDQEINRKVEFQRQYNRQAALLRFTTGQSQDPTGMTFDFQYTLGTTDFNNNPDVMAATQRISSAQADAKFAESSRLPSLTVQAGAGFKNGYLLGSQPDPNTMKFNYLAGATLNIPIYLGGRTKQNIAIARKTIELNEISKNNLTLTLQKDMESAQSDLQAYDQQVKNSEGQISVAKETFRLTNVRYKQGVATYLDLVSASTLLQRAFLNQLQYEYQRTLSQVELCRLAGIKFWQE